MTKAEMRVAIAKDVIAQIEARKLKMRAHHGYIQTPDALRRDGKIKAGKTCSVCALGAAAVSKWNVFNEADRDRSTEGLHYFRAIDGLFSDDQQYKIENAFECGPYWSDIEDDEDRAIAIFQNIIDHNGTFKSNVIYEMVAG